MQAKYLSLQRLLLWRELAVPVNWQERFPRPAPLTLEIGFGNGEYLLRQSGLRAERNFVGLELPWGSIRRTLRRLHQAGRQNVRLLQVDARMALRYLFPQASLSEFCALFPCPWPKRDHAQHRLFSTSFLKLLNRALEPGGKGLVVTDHARFRDFVLAQARSTGFQVTCRSVAARYDTKYERRWSAQGQQEFFEIHFEKVEDINLPLEEVNLKSRHVDEVPASGPLPQGERQPFFIEFKRRLFDPEQQVYMFLVMAGEEGLTQTFWVEMQRKERWVISPAQGSGVLPTAAVQRALDLVYQACGGPPP